MTGVEAMKEAVISWRLDMFEHGFSLAFIKNNQPAWVKKLCHVVYRLKREVFNIDTCTWEYEGL